jgi:hypothetical protein
MYWKIEIRQITQDQLPEGVSLDTVKEDILNNPSSAWNKKWESLKPFARGEKQAIEQEAFLLQNEGDISPVFDAEDGKVIIQLIRRIPRTYKPLSAVRNEIKTLLTEKQFKKSFAKDLKDIVIQGDAQAIESLILEKSANKEVALGITKNDTRLSQELFSLHKGKYGIFVDGSTGFVVLLTDVAERHLPDFETIKDVVINDFQEERAYEALGNAVNAAKKDAQDDSFEQLAKDYNVAIQHTGLIRANDNKKLQELDKKNLPSKAMLSLDKMGSLLVHNTDRSTFLIKLTALEDNTDVSAEDNKQVEAVLDTNRKKMQIESVVASLHRNATIETNESTQQTGEEYSE